MADAYQLPIHQWRRRHPVHDMRADNNLLGMWSPPHSADKLVGGDPEQLLALQTQENGGKSATDPEWEWPCFTRYFSDGRTRTEPLKKASRKPPAATPFTVIYIEVPGGDPKVNVTLFSKHLVDVVKRILPESTAASSDTPELPATDMFLALAALKKSLEEVKDGEEQKEEEEERRCHLRHLIRFVEQEFKDTLVRREQMEAKGTVSFDMLWTFLVPGEPVRFLCPITNRPRLGILTSGKVVQAEGTVMFGMQILAMDFNVVSYRDAVEYRQIGSFHGEMQLTSLAVCPMRLFGGDRELLEKSFLEVGERFFDLAMSSQFRFVEYKGFLAFDEGRSISKHKADGRVMVDHYNFAKMHPGYNMWNALPPTDALRSKVPPHPKPEPEKLRFAPPIVYGFSFSLKRWGCFDVLGFSEISFNSTAFDELVMQDVEQKDMLLSLVREYVEHKNPPPNLDAISSKGGGCIFLCYGPPGTGKTLTAESLAERLRCPLWAMNAFELPGTNPGQMEARLLQIFDIAVSWKAILLLDEADVYMERRKRGGSTTAMTGVFLRLLEYYSGVLFLTTNRVTVFDDAFRSRISMLVEYPALGEAQRAAIWAKLLSKAGLPTEDAHSLAVHGFNGREIRNMLRVAITWAHSCDRQVSVQEVRSVVRMSLAGAEALKAAIAAASAADVDLNEPVDDLVYQSGCSLQVARH